MAVVTVAQRDKDRGFLDVDWIITRVLTAHKARNILKGNGVKNELQKVRPPKYVYVKSVLESGKSSNRRHSKITKRSALSPFW
jgi:hypothetical protein